MKTFLLSAGLALGLGAVALSPAEATPLAMRGAIAAPTATTDVACRVVKKTVYRNGVKRVTTTRECGRPGWRSDRRYDRRDFRDHHRPRPGISVHVN